MITKDAIHDSSQQQDPKTYVDSLLIIVFHRIHWSGESWDEQLQMTIQFAKQSAGSNKKGSIDWDWVGKAVAKTEPPRVRDIPAHVAFLKLYGGGSKTQHMIERTMSYLELAMPSSRIVTGTFFEKLSAHKCSPSELIPHVLHGLIMMQACGPKTREDVGMTVTDPMVKSLQNANKAAAIKANTMIENMHQLADRAKDVSRNFIIKLVGDMTIELMKLVLDMDSDYQSIDDVADAFAAALANPNEKLVRADKNDRREDESLPTQVEFSGSGGSDAGKITVLNSGFKTKGLIELKKSTAEADKQWQLEYINDDGSAGAMPIKNDGAVDDVSQNMIIIPLDKLINEYKPCKNRIELLSSYPEIQIIKSDRWKMFQLKSTIFCAMNMLIHDAGYVNLDVRVQKKPTNRVFSKSNAKEYCLRVLPLSDKMQEPKTKSAESNVEVHVDDVKVHLLKVAEEECVSEFWQIRTEPKEKNCNMVVQTFEKSVKLRSSEQVLVKIPCAVNTVPINAGDELVLYVKPAPKAKASTKAVNLAVEPSAKKHRAE